MKRWCVLAALVISGCGSGELQRVSEVRAPKCPKEVAPGPRAAAQMSKELYRKLPKLYPTLERKGAVIQGMFTLSGGLPSTIKTKRYVSGPAFRACGREVTKASWVAFVLLPNSPSASSEHVVFIVRTAKGFKVWYEWSPQNPRGTVVDV
jgi:hypothetical protein